MLTILPAPRHAAVAARLARSFSRSIRHESVHGVDAKVHAPDATAGHREDERLEDAVQESDHDLVRARRQVAELVESSVRIGTGLARLLQATASQNDGHPGIALSGRRVADGAVDLRVLARWFDTLAEE